MKKISLVAALLCASLFASAENKSSYADITDIDDLALIYIGSQHRPDWNKDLFTPYVVHTYPDGTKSWMFDGFLMIEFLAYNEQGLQVSFGETTEQVQGAKKADWERLLHEQLGTESGYGCRALDNLIDELIPELGEPGHKHKVVFTLPVAEVKSDLWGTINNSRTLDFTKVQDRIDGMKWYADQLISEWKKAGFKHLDLEGVYWTCETFGNTNLQMAQAVNQYYHDKDLKVYWIPYLTRYNAVGSTYLPAPTEDKVGDVTPTQNADNWETYGVDVVYIQPNYYFRDWQPIKYIDQAMEYADNHEFGLELEFEGYNFAWDPKTQTRSRLTPSNCGLYACSPKFYKRFVDYIDKFEENYEFEYAPLAYYSGFQGVYDFEKSGHAKDKEVINRLATLINRRHVISGWDSAPRTTGIDDIAVDDRVLAYGLEGAIYIAREGIEDAAIYSLDGKVIYAAGAISGEKHAFGETIPCEPGIYIVRIASRSIKVAVK